MKSAKFILLLFLVIFSAVGIASEFNFETASVGRTQGGLDELDKQLDSRSIESSGAEFYTDQWTDDGSESVLGKTYGPNARTTRSLLSDGWAYSQLSNSPVPSNKTLIIRSGNGEVNGNTILAADGFGVKSPVSNYRLSDSIQGGNLVVADIPFTGEHLAKMGTSESIPGQFEGKAGAVVALNGFQNSQFLKAFLCSLALDDNAQGPNNYYWFKTLGDRFRNAKNNLSEFSNGSEAFSYDYSLYGAPYLETKGTKISSEQLAKVCGDFAKYNVYPSTQAVVQDDSETGDNTFTKNIELDFSDYKIKNEGEFDRIDINGAMQQTEDGKLALPFAVLEIPLPLGTIVKNIKVVSKKDAVSINANIPKITAQGPGKDCEAAANEPEFDTVYTEDRKIVVARVFPVEAKNCANGEFTVYKTMELEAEYSPYSPVLIKKVDSPKETLPKEQTKIRVISENITPNTVFGKLVLKDANLTLDEKEITIPASSEKAEEFSYESGTKEGFYDYSVVFEQNNEEKTATNFKQKVDLVKVNLEFGGSKKYIDDFNSTPLDFRWDVKSQAGGGTSSATQGNGFLNIHAFAEPGQGISGTISMKQGIDVYDPELEKTSEQFPGSFSRPACVKVKDATSTQGGFVVDTESNGCAYSVNDNRFRHNLNCNMQHVNSNYCKSGVWEGYIDFAKWEEVVTCINGLRRTDVLIPAEYSFGNYGQSGNFEAKFAQKTIGPNKGLELSITLPQNILENPADFGICSSGNSGQATSNILGKNAYWEFSCGAFVDGKEASQSEKFPGGNPEQKTITFSVSELAFGMHNAEIKCKSWAIVNGQKDFESQLQTIYSGKFWKEGDACGTTKTEECAGNKMFSIDDLPLTIVLNNGSEVTSNGQTLADLSGNYTITKENENVIGWKKENGTAWKTIDISGFEKQNLGIGFYYAIENGGWKIRLRLIDSSGHQAEFAEFDGDIKSGTAINLNIEEIARNYGNSSRGTAAVNAIFENKGSEQVPIKGKYTIQNESGRQVGSGEIDLAANPGKSRKEIYLHGLDDPNENYNLTMESSYNYNSKVGLLSFSGNNPPRISAPDKIVADAYDKVRLDYTVSDPDGDALDTNVTAPFSSGNEWQTDEKDIGEHIVTITSSDGFGTSAKEIKITITEPKIECGKDPDCGEITVLDPRVCSGGNLLSIERKPVCKSPGTYQSYCSFVDFNRTYGKCSESNGFADGNAQTIKFGKAEEKTEFITIPANAKVTKATIKASAAVHSQTTCFDAVNSAYGNSTTLKHNFANGVSFVGLPLGSPILAASQEKTSDSMDGFPQMNFTTQTPGVAYGVQIYPYCGDTGDGKYIELVTACDNPNAGTWTANLVSNCSRSKNWVEGVFYSPYSNNQVSDFCKWNPDQRTVTVNENLNNAYNTLYGNWAGIGDSRPAFRAYVRQFDGEKELISGISGNIMDANLSANEDLRGEQIKYFMTPNGKDWSEIQNNTAIQFPIGQVDGNFLFRAVLSTNDPSETPRLHSATVCATAIGQPTDTIIYAGNTPVFSSESAGFEKEIDITNELNNYIINSGQKDGNIQVPVTFKSGSQGIIKLKEIKVEFDTLSNSPPQITSANPPGKLTLAEKGKTADFEVSFSDPDNDPVSATWCIGTADYEKNKTPRQCIENRNLSGPAKYTLETSGLASADYNISATLSDGKSQAQKTWIIGIFQPRAGTCYDHDKGLNYYEKSIADDRDERGIGSWWEDVCLLRIPCEPGEPGYGHPISCLKYTRVEECSGPLCNLQEGYCAGEKSTNIAHTCPNGCLAGACIPDENTEKIEQDTNTQALPQPELSDCSDSDGGLAKYARGTVRVGDKSYNDVCHGDDTVYEYFCENGKNSAKELNCEYSCSLGACLLNAYKPAKDENRTGSVAIQAAQPSANPSPYQAKPSPSYSPTPSPSPPTHRTPET